MNATQQDILDLLNCIQEATLAASVYIQDKIDHIASLP